MVGTKDEEVVLVIGAALAHGLDVVALTVLLAVSLAEGEVTELAALAPCGEHLLLQAFAPEVLNPKFSPALEDEVGTAAAIEKDALRRFEELLLQELAPRAREVRMHGV